MTCPTCQNSCTIRIGSVLIWCHCEEAERRRRENPHWLYFAYSCSRGSLERAA